MGEARRQYQPVDLLEFKRRLQARVESASTPNEDPLAELARIIGGEGRIVAPDAQSTEDASFGGQRRAGGGVQEPVDPPVAVPAYPVAEDRSWDRARVEPAFDEPARFHDTAEDEERQRLAPPLYCANEDPPEPTAHAHLRLRNRRRRNLSLYATVAAGLFVAGVLVVIFTRPGVSVGLAPSVRTAVAVPAAPPADASPAPTGAPDAAAAAPDREAEVQLPPPQEPVDNSGAAPSVAAQSAAPPTVAATVLPFSQPRRVQTIPVYSDGSFIDPVTSNSNSDQFVSAANSAPTAFAEPQALQTPASSPPAPPAAALNDTAAPQLTQAPASSPRKEVAAREPPKAVPSAAAKSASAEAAAGATFEAVLASPAAESDARNMLGQLQRKYAAALGGRRLTYHRVKRAGGVVFEVRVAGLGNDDAQALCAKLSKAGATCDVGAL